MMQKNIQSLNKRGMALAVIFAILIVIGIFVFMFLGLTRTERAQAEISRDRIMAKFIAEAGMQYGIAMIKQSDFGSRFYAPAHEKVISEDFSNGRFTVVFEDKKHIVGENPAGLSTRAGGYSGSDSESLPNRDHDQRDNGSGGAVDGNDHGSGEAAASGSFTKSHKLDYISLLCEGRYNDEIYIVTSKIVFSPLPDYDGDIRSDYLCIQKDYRNYDLYNMKLKQFKSETPEEKMKIFTNLDSVREHLYLTNLEVMSFEKCQNIENSLETQNNTEQPANITNAIIPGVDNNYNDLRQMFPQTNQMRSDKKYANSDTERILRILAWLKKALPPKYTFFLITTTGIQGTIQYSRPIDAARWQQFLAVLDTRVEHNKPGYDEFLEHDKFLGVFEIGINGYKLKLSDFLRAKFIEFPYVIYPAMVRIAAGHFEMGTDTAGSSDSGLGPGDFDIPDRSAETRSPGTDPHFWPENAKPKHTVRIPHGLYIAKYELTFSEFDHFSLSEFEALNFTDFTDSSNHELREKYPAIISWSEAVVFCNWLSEKFGYEKCYTYTKDTTGFANGEFIIRNTVCNFDKDGFRLPTEAEWEYVASQCGFAKTYTVYPWGNSLNTGEFCNRDHGNTDRLPPVGNYPAYNYIHDMVGSVSEWCFDSWDHNFYKTCGEMFPYCTKEVNFRVHKGGSYESQNEEELRVDHRDRDTFYGYSNECFGLRLVRTKK